MVVDDCEQMHSAEIGPVVVVEEATVVMVVYDLRACPRRSTEPAVEFSSPQCSKMEDVIEGSLI